MRIPCTALIGLLALSCGAAQPSHVAWRISGALLAGRGDRTYIQDYASSANTLSRLALPEGKRLWTADAQGQLSPECAYTDVLVTAADGSAQGLDPETGRELWRIAAEELAGDGAPILSCPEFGVAFYAVRLVGANALAAFGKNSGDTLWRYAPGGYVAVAYADAELVFVERAANAAEALVALDAATGEPRWIVPREGQPTVEVHGGVPFLVNGGTLARLDRGTGVVAWSSSLGDGPLSSRFEGDAVYVSTAHKEERLDPANGKPLWERDAAPDAPKRLADALGGAYRLRANRDLTRIDPESGEALWSFPVGVFGDLLGADDDAVYVSLLVVGPQERTTVAAIDRDDGDELWREDLRAAATLVAQDASRLYFTAISPEDGTVAVAVRKR